MAYADKDFYRTTYIGATDIDDAELDRLLERGSEWIDLQTYNRIITKGFDNLSAFQQNLIQKSNCAYTEFVLGNAEYENISPINTGFSLGDLSLKGSNAKDYQSSTKPTRAINFLNRSGLNYKGIVSEGYFDE